MLKFDEIQKFVIALFTDRSARVAAAALVVDLVLVASTMTIMVGWPWKTADLSNLQQIFLISELLGGFAIIWFIFFLLSREELVDVFTTVRKQISGRWLVTYSASVSYEGTEERNVTCDIVENLIRKLEFRFDIIGNPIFEDQRGQIVKDIALRETDAQRYSLFYYFETNRRLVKELRKLIAPGNHHTDEIQIETLGIVNFEAPIASGQNVE